MTWRCVEVDIRSDGRMHIAQNIFPYSTAESDRRSISAGGHPFGWEMLIDTPTLFVAVTTNRNWPGVGKQYTKAYLMYQKEA